MPGFIEHPRQVEDDGLCAVHSAATDDMQDFHLRGPILWNSCVATIEDRPKFSVEAIPERGLQLCLDFVLSRKGRQGAGIRLKEARNPGKLHISAEIDAANERAERQGHRPGLRSVDVRVARRMAGSQHAVIIAAARQRHGGDGGAQLVF